MAIPNSVEKRYTKYLEKLGRVIVKLLLENGWKTREEIKVLSDTEGYNFELPEIYDALRLACDTGLIKYKELGNHLVYTVIHTGRIVIQENQAIDQVKENKYTKERKTIKIYPKTEGTLILGITSIILAGLALLFMIISPPQWLLWLSLGLSLCGIILGFATVRKNPYTDDLHFESNTGLAGVIINLFTFVFMLTGIALSDIGT